MKITVALAVLVVVLSAPPHMYGQPAGQHATRIVSVVPSLTEALFAIGAGTKVIGVGSYDQFPAEVQTLPRVGALLDPNAERILSLRPDLVIVYGSQSDLQVQLGRAGLRTYAYRHGGIDTALESIGDLGVLTGHTTQADALVTSLRARLDAVRASVKGRRRPRTLLVFERQAGSLRGMYASGGIGFLHEMLEIAGGQNVFGDVQRESVQPSMETLLTRAPEVILEVRATGLLEDRDVEQERATWSALASIPAVRTGRIYLLTGDYLVVPGPRLANATEALARVLHDDRGIESGK